MELMYVWVDSHKNLKHLDVNLSNDFHFQYDYEKGELEVVRKLNYGLFKMPAISSLTAIVGQNGVGKSTIIEIIQKLIYGFGEINSRLIFIFGNEEDAFLYRYNGNYEEKLLLNKVSGRNFFQNNLKVENYVHTKKRVKRGNSFNTVSFKGLEKYFDCFLFSNVVDGSTVFLRKNNLSSNRGFRVVGRNHELSPVNEVINSIKCMYDLGQEFGLDKELSFPEYLDLDFNKSYRVLHSSISKKRKIDLRKVKSIIQSKLNYYYRYERFDSLLEVNVITSILCYFVEHSKRRNSRYFQFKTERPEEISYFAEEILEIYTSEEPFKLKDELLKLIAKYSGLAKEYGLMNASDELNEIALFLQEFTKMSTDFTFRTDEEFSDFDPSFMSLKIDGLVNMFLLHVKKQVPFIYSYMNISWRGRSSGEIALLSFYSRFYNLKSKIESINKPILILIDEADLYLHPKWQREYLSNITTFLNKIFPDNRFQIILTTHSPFIISDVSKENIMLLYKDGWRSQLSDKETNFNPFGANYYTILAQSFFLKEGMLGKLATEKISEVFKKLKRGDINEADRKIVKMIGDKNLRRILESKIEKHDSNL